MKGVTNMRGYDFVEKLIDSINVSFKRNEAKSGFSQEVNNKYSMPDYTNIQKNIKGLLDHGTLSCCESLTRMTSLKLETIFDSLLLKEGYSDEPERQ